MKPAEMNSDFCKLSFTRWNFTSWLPGGSFDTSRHAAKVGRREVIAHHFQTILRWLVQGLCHWRGHTHRGGCVKPPCVHRQARDMRPQPALWTCRRICEQQQMVSMRWGMLRWENASILTGIPWRPSLRCGMLFLSWDWRVWAWMPEGWSSARRRADFSPLRAPLPWLSAHTGPKHWMRNVCSPHSAWFGCLFFFTLSFLSQGAEFQKNPWNLLNAGGNGQTANQLIEWKQCSLRVLTFWKKINKKLNHKL